MYYVAQTTKVIVWIEEKHKNTIELLTLLLFCENQNTGDGALPGEATVN